MIFDGPKTEDEINDFLKTRVESLGLSDDVEEFLLRSNVRTIGGLIRVDGGILYNTGDIENIINILSGVFDIKLIGGRSIKFVPKYYKVDKNDDENIEVKEQKYQDTFFTGPKIEDEINDFLKTRVESLGLSKRVENSLLGSGIRTISGIIRKNNDGLYNLNGMGSKGVEEIIKSLSYAFNIIIEDKNIKFIPKYYRESEKIIKEKSEEEKIEEELKKIELNRIEKLYFEKQEEKEFIYQTKIVSLGIDQSIEAVLFDNNIFIVGDLLKETLEDFREKYFFNEEEINSIIDIFNYLILKNKKIEEEQDELRKKALDLKGYLPHSLDKERSVINNADLIISKRDLNILKLFRSGLTLDQIGKENNISRERARQIVVKILNKIGLSHEEEIKKIRIKRDELKPKKIKKEKKWGAGKFDFCISCNATEFPHSKHGLCEKCDGAFSGERRDKIISENGNKCNICEMVREEAIDKYQHDLFITKDQDVLCKKCFLENTGKKLGSYRNYTWSRFYEKCKSCGTQSLPYHRNGLCIDCFGYITNQEREKIIEMSDNKCSSCGISRTDSNLKYNKDLCINKEGKVLCNGCHLEYLRTINNNKWRMFYN